MLCLVGANRLGGSSLFEVGGFSLGCGEIVACGGVSPSCRRPSHFSLRGQRKVTQRKAIPGASPFGCVRVGRAFRQGILPWRKGIDIRVDAPAGLIVQPSPTHRGPEGQGQHQGQHQDQDQEQKQRLRLRLRQEKKAQHSVFALIPNLAASAPPPACRGRLGGGEGLPQDGTPPQPSPASRGGSSAASRHDTESFIARRLLAVAPECAQDARCSWGPYTAVRLGRISPQGHRHGCRCLFARAGALSKSSAQPHVLEGQDARRARYGVGLSLGYFSLATQRKVTRTPAGVRKPAAGEPDRETITNSPPLKTDKGGISHV